MKKHPTILLITIIAILLGACTKEIPTINNNTTDKSDELEKCYTYDKEEQKKECIENYAISESYSYNMKGKTINDSAVCELLDVGSYSWTKCYWNFALGLKEKSLCEKLPETFDKVSSAPKYASYEFEKQIKENCEKEINYKTEKAEWGIKDYEDDWYISYTGRGEIKGWLIYKPYYIGEDEPHFHIADESKKDLPWHMVVMLSDEKNEYYSNYYFTENREEIVEKLKNSSEENPATIIADGFSIPMEGSASINIVEVLE